MVDCGFEYEITCYLNNPTRISDSFRVGMLLVEIVDQVFAFSFDYRQGWQSIHQMAIAVARNFQFALSTLSFPSHLVAINRQFISIELISANYVNL